MLYRILCLFLLFSSSSIWAESPFSDITQNSSSDVTQNPFSDVTQTTIKSSDSGLLLFKIQGSNTVGAELAPRLVESWLESHQCESIQRIASDVANEQRINATCMPSGQQVYVDIAAHGSSTGFKALVSNDADIAAASRKIKEQEKNLLDRYDMASVTSEHIIGIDGLSIIVHPNNPIRSLSLTQLRQIFSGEITNWSQLGGVSGDIAVYARDNNSGTWDSFSSMVLEQQTLTASARRFESNDLLSDTVAADFSGIGFVGLSSVRQAKAIAIASGDVPALMPNPLTVATEDYALSRRLYLYTKETSKNAFVRDFLSYALDQGQPRVAEVGFVSQKIEAVKPDSYVNLPSEIRAITHNASRLSANFRFNKGSARLDNKAQRDIQRIVDYLAAHPNEEIILMGFGDASINEEREMLLSRHRAMAVSRQLKQENIYAEVVEGFGSALPIAAVADQEGRLKNRRVEVWVRPQNQ
ncbi:MAG: phosphate ABC transporter substrate-binding/OmpA family protein, partial [Oleibacter sp.]|nr:phosphate ABC transporter substrate-binding/OmpA family protein [Thalassolituus sp.]